MREMVQVQMLHASVYSIPLKGEDGTELKREVLWNDIKMMVPAYETVYLHPDEHNGGIFSVPRADAERFIAQGSAVWPKKIVELVPDAPTELSPIPAAPLLPASKGKATKVENAFEPAAASAAFA
jgi:hypothetical protein